MSPSTWLGAQNLEPGVVYTGCAAQSTDQCEVLSIAGAATDIVTVGNMLALHKCVCDLEEKSPLGPLASPRARGVIYTNGVLLSPQHVSGPHPHPDAS